LVCPRWPARCGRDEEAAPQADMVPEPSADDGLVELMFVQEAASA